MTVPLTSHDQMDFEQHFSEWTVSNDPSWPHLPFLNLCDALHLTADRFVLNCSATNHRRSLIHAISETDERG